MKTYSNKLIFDYVNGNDIYGVSVDDLENNPDFMMDVIKYTKDKRMYDLCSDSVKTNYEFVKFMIGMFKKDVDFVSSLALTYLNNTKEEDITHKEILILVGELEGNSDELLTIKLKKSIFNTLEMGTIDLELRECDPKLKQELGMVFLLIINDYGFSDVIKKYFAKEFIKKIFFKENMTLEEFIHKQVKTFEMIRTQGINTFLINYIERYDHYLSTYVSNHIDLLEDLRKEVIKIGNNWDRYMDNINRRRVNIINQEVYNYIDEHNVVIRDSVDQLIRYVIRKYNLEDIFNKYDNVIDEDQINISINDIDEGKMNLMELKCLKYISDLVNELFEEDIIGQKEFEDINKKYNGASKIIQFNANSK